MEFAKTRRGAQGLDLRPGEMARQGTSPTLDGEVYDSLQERTFNQVTGRNVNVGVWEHIGRGSAAVLTDVADSVWSTPLNPLGDRGDIWDLVSTEQRAYYERNKEIIEGGSAIVGAISIAAAAEAMLIPRLTQSLMGSTAITSNRAFQATLKWNESARRGALLAQQEALAAGEAWSIYRSKAGLNLLANQSARTAAVFTRTVPLEYALLWNNEAFNTGNLAEEAMFIGLGGGIGAAAGLVQARGLARRMANSAEAQDVIAASLPMAGVMESQLYSNFAGKNYRAKALQLRDSTALTHSLIGARANYTEGMDTPAALQLRTDQMRAQYESAAGETMNQIFAKGAMGIESAAAGAKSIPEARYIVTEVAKRDPYMMLGMEELAIPVTDFRSAIKARGEAVEEMWKMSQNAQGTLAAAEAKRMAAKAARFKRQQPFALINGSWADPTSEFVDQARSIRMSEIEAGIKMEKDTVLIPKSHMQSRGGIRIDGTLMPKREGADRSLDVAGMNHRDRFALFAGARKLIDSMVSGTSGAKFRLNDKSEKSWFSLDLAAEILRKGGNINIDPSSSLRTLEDIERQALRLKARDLLERVGQTGAIDAEMRLRYNLPEPTAMERLEDLDGDAFRVFIAAAAKDEGTLKELSQALDSTRAIHGLDLLPAQGSRLNRLDGDILNYNRDERGKWMRPMLGFFEPRQQMPQKAWEIHEELMKVQKAEMYQRLTDDVAGVPQAPFVKNLTRMPEFQVAHGVNRINDAQSTGLGNKVGRIFSEFMPQRHKHRDNPVLLAASRLQEVTEREGRIAFDQMMKASQMQNVVDAISQTQNAGLRAELDQFASLRPGWDIGDAVDVGGGRWAFPLQDTPTNRKLLGVEKVAKETMMPNLRTGQNITVSQAGLDALNAFELMTQTVRKGTNAVRTSRGYDPIAFKPNFMPSQDTRGKLVGFVQDPAGQIVPMRTIVAGTRQEYDRMVAKTLDELGDGYLVKSRENMTSASDMYDRHASQWVDHGYSSATAGKGSQKGGLTGAYTKDGAFLDALEWVKRQTLGQYTDTLETLMQEPIRAAKMRAATERHATGVTQVGAKAEKGEKAPTRNIFDEYEQALTGRSFGFKETAIASKFSRAAEDVIDEAIMLPARHLTDMASRFGVNPARLGGKKTYAQIVEELGPNNPYASAVEYLEAQGIRQPPSVRRAAQKINQLATNVILRWDPLAAHAAMNMLGLIPTLMAGTRAGHAPATLTMNVKGKQVPFVDSIAIIKRGIDRMFRGKNGPDWAMMMRNGDASQSATEYHQMMGQIKNQAGYHKFLDKIDSGLAWASDGSENMSRQMSHFVGLEMAKYQGIRNIDDAHAFAREFANAAIADYTPSNRPELYQTSLGSVFGLFQSYVVNQYSKMFHWLELGDYKAFGTQMAAQASLFGISGTYGVNSVFSIHDALFREESGDPSLMDRLYARFGPTAGAAISHGGIQALTGIAMYTRGDINIRVPGANGQLPPGPDLIRRTVNTVTGSVQVALNNAPDHIIPGMLEVVQREMPNRVLKGILGQIHGGMETDRSGNVIHSTESWLEAAARVSGYRSQRQQVELEAYYAGRADMERDASRMEKVRNEFRTAVRKSARGGTQVDPMRFFEDYVASGGNPRTFKTWARKIIRDAATPRAAAELRKNMAIPRNALNTWRYGAYGAWDIEYRDSK